MTASTPPDADHSLLAARLPLLSPARGAGERRVLTACTALALAGHLGAVVALTWPAVDARIGIGGTELTAIAVEIVSESDVARSAAARAIASTAAGTGGAPSAVAARHPTADPVETGALPEPRERLPEVAPPLPAVREADSEGATATLVETVSAAVPEQTRDTQRVAEARQPIVEQPNGAGGGGGAGSEASVATTSIAPAAAPSAGALRAFGTAVARALERTAPQSGRWRGNVAVAFLIDAAGALETLQVARTSGNDRLDKMAIDSVRRARLPRPPEGTLAADRSFTQEYKFR